MERLFGGSGSGCRRKPTGEDKRLPLPRTGFIEKTEDMEMENYEVLYKVLFNGMTNAVRELEGQNYGNAHQVLVKAQQDAEEIFMNDGEEENATASAE
jgi:hypothetical protein